MWYADNITALSIMQNEVWLEPNSSIIVSAYHGDQTSHSVQEAIECAQKFIGQLRQNHQPVYILINASDVKNQDSEARTKALDAFNTLDFDKLAIFGAPVFIKYVVQFLILAANKQTTIQYFNLESDARNWLNQPAIQR